jgi:hypothetical protein
MKSLASSAITKRPKLLGIRMRSRVFYSWPKLAQNVPKIRVSAGRIRPAGISVHQGPITRDDDVGVARDSALDNAVIRLVVEDGQLSPRSYEFGQIRQKDRRSGKLLWAAGELVCQYVQHLVDDLFGYAEVQLALYDQVDSQTRAGPPPSRATCARGPTLYMSIASATSTDPPAASNGQPFALATASSWSFASIRL